MANKGRYFGLFGAKAHRRYLQTFPPKSWELFVGYGGSPLGLRSRWHREFYMAQSVHLKRGRTGWMRVVATFPVVLPIRGTLNPPGAFRPYPH